jgi:hypothetical protein
MDGAQSRWMGGWLDGLGGNTGQDVVEGGHRDTNGRDREGQEDVPVGRGGT